MGLIGNFGHSRHMEDFTGTINSKLPQVGTTIFTVMSALANKHGAVNLSQGFPDFPVSEELIDLVTKYMQDGMNQYAPMQGVPKLREVIADKVEKLYGGSYDPGEEINVTAGATQAIYTAITACVREGDEVIIFTPAYDCYEPAVSLVGGKSVFVQLKTPDYRVDWDEVKKMVNGRTRMIIINTPHNPTGAVWSEDDMRQLEKITSGTDIIVLSDEVYEHIIFDGKQHESVCKYPELASRSLVVLSFGKTFHATGWKMGYIMGPSTLMKEFRKVHQFNVFTCHSPVQYALADFLESEKNYKDLGAFYQQKRDLFMELVSGSRFKPVPTYGTYFQLLDYSDITDEGDVEYAERLTIESGIASIPVSVFYNAKTDNKVLRFCFAKSDETLQKGAEILCKI